jgi:DNA-binding transcriptional ArsR family regulator
VAAACDGGGREGRDDGPSEFVWCAVVSEGRGRPDYEFLDEVLAVTEPEQFKAVGDSTRQRIIVLLSERAATTSQLAEALGQPKGSVGHHLKVLESAGLIRVVRTRQARALTEKYYGRTARLFEFHDIGRDEEGDPFRFFRQVMNEAVLTPPEAEVSWSTLRYARIPAEKAREFQRRVLELADEFGGHESVPEENVYALLGGVYLTDLPELPKDEG